MDKLLLQDTANLSIITAFSVIYLKLPNLFELDGVLEIQEYMEQQEEIIKFRSKHYNECGCQSIQNRQATPFIQCAQNLQESSSAKSSSSPEYYKASSIEDSTTEDSETDDSDTSSDTTEQYAWSVLNNSK